MIAWNPDECFDVCGCTSSRTRQGDDYSGGDCGAEGEGNRRDVPERTVVLPAAGGSAAGEDLEHVSFFLRYGSLLD